MTTNRVDITIEGKYRIRQYYTDDNLWKETRTLIKKKKKKRLKRIDGLGDAPWL